MDVSESAQLRFTPGSAEISVPGKSAVRTDGYTVVRGALSREITDLASTYFLLRGDHPDASRGTRVTNFYADALGESLLVQLQPLVEQASGWKLLPTYSKVRIYWPGSDLPCHTDRPSCELTASLTLGYQASELWPIFLENRDESAEGVRLDRGDLLVYLGSLLHHWREKFEGK